MLFCGIFVAHQKRAFSRAFEQSFNLSIQRGKYQPKLDEEGLQEEIDMSWIIAKKYFGDKSMVKVFRDGELKTLTAVHKPFQKKKLVQDLLMTHNGLARGPAYAITGFLGVTEATQQYLSEMYNAHDGEDVSSVPEQYVRARAAHLEERIPVRIIFAFGFVSWRLRILVVWRLVGSPAWSGA